MASWACAARYFLASRRALPLAVLLPAAALGCFATAVLNVNNIRDINSDGLAGKITIPVRLGPRHARRYHWLLLLLGLGCATVVRGPHLPLALAVAVCAGRAAASLFNGCQVWAAPGVPCSSTRC
ncbi:MAG: UbiA family prenyltransferase [Hymenobacter sp.]